MYLRARVHEKWHIVSYEFGHDLVCFALLDKNGFLVLGELLRETLLGFKLNELCFFFAKDVILVSNETDLSLAYWVFRDNLYPKTKVQGLFWMNLDLFFFYLDHNALIMRLIQQDSSTAELDPNTILPMWYFNISLEIHVLFHLEYFTLLEE
ncbi:hypothetical protein ACJX0J_025065, partial [Zea mays]